jgi:hypothetical protein
VELADIVGFVFYELPVSGEILLSLFGSDKLDYKPAYGATIFTRDKVRKRPGVEM